jgi:hypothetical protein
LKLGWDYPVYQGEEKPTTGTVARAMRHSLSELDAFRYIAGKDPRPLLVLRECQVCNGTDDALLSKGADNERTLLLSVWFHCVKLPVDVLEPNHPFYELFSHDDPEHLFVAMVDGTSKVKLESQTSRTELWDAMGVVLDASYKKDPQPVVKLVQKSLDRLDVLDERLLDSKAKRNELLETEGAKSSKLEKIDGEIAQATAQIETIKQEIAAATKLELKSPEALKAGSAPTKADR